MILLLLPASGYVTYYSGSASSIVCSVKIPYKFGADSRGCVEREKITLICSEFQVFPVQCITEILQFGVGSITLSTRS